MIDYHELTRLHALCIKALEQNPVETQFDHLEEEMAELTLARKRLWRERTTEEDVLEEIVDVFMCTVEMGVHHYGADRFNEMLKRKNDKFEASLGEQEEIDWQARALAAEKQYEDLDRAVGSLCREWWSGGAVPGDLDRDHVASECLKLFSASHNIRHGVKTTDRPS